MRKSLETWTLSKFSGPWHELEVVGETESRLTETRLKLKSLDQVAL